MTAQKVKGHTNLYRDGDNLYIRFRHKGKDRWIATGVPSLSRLKRSEIYRDFHTLGRERFLSRWDKGRAGKSLNDWRTDYIEHVKRMGIRNIENPTVSLKRLCEHLGAVRVEDVGRAHIEGFRNALAEAPAWAGKVERPMAKSTVNHYLESISAFFSWLVRQGVIEKNPCLDVERFKEKGFRDRYIEPEEEEKLLAACKPWFAPWIIFAIETGCRKGEIAKLKRADVDLRKGRNGIITLRDRKNRGTDNTHISKRAAEVLRHIPVRIDTPYMFMGPKGKPLVSDKYRKGYLNNPLERELRRAWEAAGVPKVIYHDFRHTFASRHAMMGTDLATVAKLGGWRSVRVLEERYVHLQPDHLEAAADRSFLDEMKKREKEKKIK